MEYKDSIQINGKIIGVIAILLLLVLGTFGLFFVEHNDDTSSSSSIAINKDNRGLASSAVNGEYDDIPDKCKLPKGQDVDSWKEHLGHHAETQDCLQYFK